MSPSQDEWDVLLSQVSFALNAAIYAGTQVSPFKCIYGFIPHLPIDHALASLQDNKVQSVSDLVRERARVQAFVTRNLSKYNKAMQTQANKGRRDVNFEVG